LHKSFQFTKSNPIGGVLMSNNKIKKNPSTIGLESSQVEGQGTTTKETGNFAADSSRKKQKKS
jgi:YuzL-like protein